MIQRCSEVIGPKCLHWNHEGQWLLDSKDIYTKYLMPGKMCPVLYGPRDNESTRNQSSLVLDSYLHQWRRYWDTRKTVLVEKSPQSMLKIPFIHTLFSRAFKVKFLVVIKVHIFKYQGFVLM